MSHHPHLQCAVHRQIHSVFIHLSHHSSHFISHHLSLIPLTILFVVPANSRCLPGIRSSSNPLLLSTSFHSLHLIVFSKSFHLHVTLLVTSYGHAMSPHPHYTTNLPTNSPFIQFTLHAITASAACCSPLAGSAFASGGPTSPPPPVCWAVPPLPGWSMASGQACVLFF